MYARTTHQIIVLGEVSFNRPGVPAPLPIVELPDRGRSLRLRHAHIIHESVPFVRVQLAQCEADPTVMLSSFQRARPPDETRMLARQISNEGCDGSGLGKDDGLRVFNYQGGKLPRRVHS